MGHVPVALRLLRFLPLAAVLLLAIPSGYAQTVDLSGRYQCAQAKMRGKVIPCNAAPLILKNDGRFELRGWERVCGSRTIKMPATVSPAGSALTAPHNRPPRSASGSGCVFPGRYRNDLRIPEGIQGNSRTC